MSDSLRQTSAQRETDVFTRIGWLSEVPTEFRTEVLRRCDMLAVEPGAAITKVGDETTSLYGVAEGQIGIHVAPHGGNSTLIHLVGPGFWTGEVGAVAQAPRVIALVARTPARVLRLPRSALQRIVEKDPLVWRFLTLLVVRNNARAIAVIAALRRDNAAERLAATLANLAANLSPGDAARPAVIRVSQQDLGAIARLSRGSVNAGLARLETAGLIVRDYAAITLADPSALDAFTDRA
jgi:CRP-like cAMP-binding protein